VICMSYDVMLHNYALAWSDSLLDFTFRTLKEWHSEGVTGHGRHSCQHTKKRSSIIMQEQKSCVQKVPNVQCTTLQ
jgi:hypothetical protein